MLIDDLKSGEWQRSKGNRTAVLSGREFDQIECYTCLGAGRIEDGDSGQMRKCLDCSGSGEVTRGKILYMSPVAMRFMRSMAQPTARCCYANGGNLKRVVMVDDANCAKQIDATTQRVFDSISGAGFVYYDATFGCFRLSTAGLAAVRD